MEFHAIQNKSIIIIVVYFLMEPVTMTIPSGEVVYQYPRIFFLLNMEGDDDVQYPFHHSNDMDSHGLKEGHVTVATNTFSKPLHCILLPFHQ